VLDELMDAKRMGLRTCRCAVGIFVGLGLEEMELSEQAAGVVAIGCGWGGHAHHGEVRSKHWQRPIRCIGRAAHAYRWSSVVEGLWNAIDACRGGADRAGCDDPHLCRNVALDHWLILIDNAAMFAQIADWAGGSSGFRG
jgi:hypothetical protein